MDLSSSNNNSSQKKDPGIRLLRRPNPASRDPASRHVLQKASTINHIDSELVSSKIGAPIIRPVQSRSSDVIPNQQRLLKDGEISRKRHTNYESIHTRRDFPLKPFKEENELILAEPPLLPPPSLDLANDSQWPSMNVGVACESGRGTAALVTPMGWSAIVRSAAPKKSLLVKKSDKSKDTGEAEGIESGMSEEEEEDDDDGREVRGYIARDGRNTGGGGGGGDGGGHGKEKKRKKKKRNKSGGGDQQQNPQEKKLDKPPQLDIFEYVRQVPIRPVLNRSEAKTPRKEETGNARNILDSTAPSLRRGKERETPKAKKPTQLRKIIELEKAKKKELREKGLPIPSDLNVRRINTEQDINDSVDNEVTSNAVDESLTTVESVSLEATPNTLSSVATPTSPSITSSSTANEDKSIAEQKRPIHGRRFREYCTHVVTDEINSVVQALLSELVRFQDRQHQRDPVKARSKRRYVCGLREVHKHLQVGKIKCVIFPPNLDPIQSTGGIDERVVGILSACEEKEVQVVYAMSRRRLAVILRKKFKIGCVGIFNYDGAEAHYRKMKILIEEATALYQRLAHPRPPSEGSLENEISTPDGDPQIFHSVGERNSSDDEEYTSEPERENEISKLDLWDKHLPTQRKEFNSSESAVVHLESKDISSEFCWNIDATEFVPSNLHTHS